MRLETEPVDVWEYRGMGASGAGAAGTSEPITFRAARAADAAAMVETFIAAIPPPIAAVHILGAPRASHFVRDSITAASRGGDSMYWVAERDGHGIVGFVQLRQSLKVAVIDNLHVLPAYQRQGIGTAMLRIALDRVSTERVGIDVFRGSDAAMALYLRIGFEEMHVRHWRILAPEHREPRDFYVHDLPQAEALQRAYSVSMLHIETAHGSHAVGRIGDRWFRVMSSRALEDDALRAALWQLDPGRSILAVLSRDDDRYPEAPDLISSRLEGDAAELRSAVAP